ncbi:BACON domain-containing protein [Streptomyces fractus]|uniref:BACON domain-containing protein n=1 Tax=Streptomyces fractus TaxID=641806 RepID=UPI003CEA2E7B
MSSRPETPTQTTGAHRAHRAGARRQEPRSAPQRPPARYEPCLDGLFTYCLSVLCDHDEATEALGDALALAERRGSRAPAGDSPAERRAWLYALARWSCLRRLAEANRRRQSAQGSAQGSAREGAREGGRPQDGLLQEERRRQLAQLAWPEAAGTTPEQREALELAVRHQLSPREVAAVLGTDPTATRELLSAAACEVERTRAALAVVETGTCPSVARLTGDNQVLLSAALRRELVRHVDDCPRCRRTAERAAPRAWPGTSVTPAALPLVEAPRPALHFAMHGRHTGAPRFDRRGYPMDPKDRAARRDRLRSRAVTTTVVATVVAAPVLALWAAYRGAPLTGEAADGRSVTASEDGTADSLDGERTGGAYENAGNARTSPDPSFTAGSRSPDVSVEVTSPPTRAGRGPGRITVEAQPSGNSTAITLTASGRTPVDWTASTDASWLYLSQAGGTLRPGESHTIHVYVNEYREPRGHWTAHVGIDPSGAVISLEGYGGSGSGGGGTSRPSPSHSVPSSPSHPRPTPTPTHSSPDPTPDPTGSSTPSPSDPEPSDSAPPSDPASPSGTGGSGTGSPPGTP